MSIPKTALRFLGALLLAFAIGASSGALTTPATAAPVFQCPDLGCILDRCVEYDGYECIENNGACAGQGCL